MGLLSRLGASALVALLATGAEAHVSAVPGQAKAGSYEAVRFRVGHGCENLHATTAVRIEIPAGMTAARPQPKPGWTLKVERASAAKDAPVTAVTWSGALPADQFDEFAILFHLPAQPATLYFPTVQTCGAHESRWIQIPDSSGTRPKSPAPALRLIAPEPSPQGGHQH
jgi:uncharacterized protein YcnI